MRRWPIVSTVLVLGGCLSHVQLPHAPPETASWEDKQAFAKQHAPVRVKSGLLGPDGLELASGALVQAPEDLLPVLPQRSTTRNLALMSESARTDSDLAATFIGFGLGIIAASVGAGFVHGLNVGNYDALWVTLTGSAIGAFMSLTAVFTSGGLRTRASALKQATFDSYQADFRGASRSTLADLPGAAVEAPDERAP
jgi:hypothetical protein